MTLRADGDLELPGQWRKGGALFLHSRFNSIGLGPNALNPGVTGANNVAIGTLALNRTASGVNNVAIGTLALNSNESGVNNVAIGVTALERATGSSNVAVGTAAGTLLQAGSNNLYLAHLGVATESNTTRIGAFQTRAFIAGVRGTTTGAADAIPVLIDSNGQLGTVSSSARHKDDISDMADASDRLHQLRPVTFRYVRPYAGGARLEADLDAQRQVIDELRERLAALETGTARRQ